jgi:hypothetical protein
MSNCQYGVFCTYPKIALKNDTKCQNEKNFWAGDASQGWSQGDASPSHIIKQCIMLKATYSEEDIYETWQLVALVELSLLGKYWSVSQKRLVSMSRVGEVRRKPNGLIRPPTA